MNNEGYERNGRGLFKLIRQPFSEKAEEKSL